MRQIGNVFFCNINRRFSFQPTYTEKWDRLRSDARPRHRNRIIDRLHLQLFRTRARRGQRALQLTRKVRRTQAPVLKGKNLLRALPCAGQGAARAGGQTAKRIGSSLWKAVSWTIVPFSPFQGRSQYPFFVV